MKNKEIFNVLLNANQVFINNLHLDYCFYNDQYIENNKIKGIYYKEYRQNWRNINKSLELSFCLVYYLIYPHKEVEGQYRLRLYIYKYEDNTFIDQIDLNKCIADKFLSSLSLNDYFEKQIKRPVLSVNDFEGQTLEEKLNHFFIWFQDNIDQRLIKILKGEDWFEIPSDWHGYK